MMNNFYQKAENHGWSNYVASRAMRIAKEANWKVTEEREISWTGEDCTLLTFARGGQFHDIEIDDNETWESFLCKAEVFADSANPLLRALFYEFAAA